MCGLFGYFAPKGARPVRFDMDRALGIIRHRGPDGEDRWSAEDGRYHVGFRRLAIIDLATGDQPIVSADGRHVLAGNGEIYNYRELRAAHPDYPYRSNGDIETALPVIDAVGARFVDALNGMYGLAHYERDAHRLTLVRDRFGVKPLYWARVDGGGIAFASEIKALFASGLVRPVVNEDAVPAYIGHGYVPAPMTIFEGVNKLPPAHTLRVDADGSVAIERYWQARPANDMPADKNGIRERLLELLSDSVRLQLRSDVPIGILLSGGLDSGMLTALGARHAETPLHTFTVSFEGAPKDEAPLAAEVAERYGTRHTRLVLPAADAGAYLPKLAWHMEEPLFDAAVLPNFLIEEALGRELRVALNGTGGDEIFAGYGRYRATPVETRYLALPAAVRGAARTAAGWLSPMTAWRLDRAESFAGDPGGYLYGHTTQFPEPYFGLIGHPHAAPAPTQRLHAGEGGWPRETRALVADIGTYLPEDLLLLLDRTSMAVSVEGRVPFLDHRVVEAALAVPPVIRSEGGRQKALQRDLARDLLPASLLDAPKQGFASPVAAWMRSGLAGPAKRLLTRPAALERGWWTAAGVARLFADTDRHAFRIHSLVMLEMAVRLLVEEPLAASAPTASLADIADA